MGEAVLLVLIIAGVISVTFCICFVAMLLIRKSTEIEKEREKSERIIHVEELKNERARLSNEKSAIYANRDMVNAQLEAGVLGNDKGEEDGVSALISQVLPFVLQNPELSSKLQGIFGNKNASVPGLLGGEAVQNAASFQSAGNSV